MLVPSSPAPWAGSLLWLLALTIMAFGVSWLVADRLRVRRTHYITVLTLTTLALSAGYVRWLGVSTSDLLTNRWLWGVMVAAPSAAFISIAMTKLPGGHRLTAGRLGLTLIWEAVIYGIAEGLLLSALPVLMTWQLVHSLDWQGAPGAIARWTLPIAASVVVITVHHLGYWEYRNRLLVPIGLGVGLLSAGFLITASPIAPTLGHIICHTTALLRGAELPPHPHARPQHRSPFAGARGRAESYYR